MCPTPKVIKVMSYAIQSKEEDYEIDPEYTSYWIEKYDEAGKLLEKRYTKDFTFKDNEEYLIERYEYDEKGRLLQIVSNRSEEPQECHFYDTDNDGNEIEIVSQDDYYNDADEFTDASQEIHEYFGAVHVFTVKSPAGVLLAKWVVHENLENHAYYVFSYEKYLYDDNGNLAEVIQFCDVEIDEDGSIRSAKEFGRLKVTIEKSGDKTVTIRRNDSGQIESKETIVICRDANGVEHPKEYILEDEHGIEYRTEYEYPENSFDHYIKYDLDGLDQDYRTEYWVEQ